MNEPPTSASWYQRAAAVMPGGVNSPVRAFKSVGRTPPFVVNAAGAHMETVDGDKLIDFISSWGALILGHARPEIIDELVAAARKGTSFGVPTSGEVELAELIVSLVPSVDVVRMVNSGTEAEPDSPGVPPATVADTRVATFNDLATVERAFAAGDVAGVIVEPVAGNMGVVPPAPGFLAGLRDLCDRNGALLIFDEVMTGFRVALGGAQERYGVTPDLTTLGKIVAGGAPAAAYGGREDLMRMVAPDGPVYQAGTLAGNPIAVAAGIACLRYLTEHRELYATLEDMGERLETRLTAALEAAGGGGCVQRVGSMLTVFLGPEAVRSWDDAAKLDRDRFTRYYHAAFDGGIILPPSPFEAMFLMEDHGPVIDEAAETLAAAIGAA